MAKPWSIVQPVSTDAILVLGYYDSLGAAMDDIYTICTYGNINASNVRIIGPDGVWRDWYGKEVSYGEA